MPTTAEDSQREQNRCRALLEARRAELWSAPGALLDATVIREVLARAEQAEASGDAAEVLESYEEMRGLE